MFQSTRPRGARLDGGGHRGIRLYGFNPRAREGRDQVGCARLSQSDVSIHAPARGATKQAGVEREIVGVSIHAPARGATSSGSAFNSLARCFNPRAREGRDGGRRNRRRPLESFNPRAREGRDDFTRHAATCGQVSIHAPARGATVQARRSLLARESFNPRAREGRDSLRLCCERVQNRFQSTRPRGARLRSAISTNVSRRFQSTRPRGARRLSLDVKTLDDLVSIHAPARGATQRISFLA